MSRTKLFLWMGTSGMALVLAGCEGGSLLKKPDGEASAFLERPAVSQLVDQDIEAPEVFQQQEAGLWDGRPSLGGVWVAHPDVKAPERVIIRNEATGKQVIGALFRRERENPGPRLQVSSDAATALGLLAGAPTELAVTALRRAEPEAAPAASPVPEVTENDPLPIADADAATQPGTASNVPATSVASAERAAPGTEVADPAAQAEVAEAAPAKKKGLFGLFRKKSAAPEATPEPVLEAPDSVDTVTLAPAPAAETESQKLATAAVATIAASSVDTSAPAGSAPVPASAPAASDPVALVDGPDGTALDEPVAPRKKRWSLFNRKTARPAAPASALKPEALTATAAVGAAIDSQPIPATAPAGRSFVQIGTFSLKKNAERAANTMRNGGVVPTVTETRKNGTTYWTVLAGPVNGAGDQTALVRKVADMGFPDALVVTR